MGNVKNHDYKNNSQCIPELSDENIRVISKVEIQFFQNVITNVNKKVKIYEVAGGYNLSDIVFCIRMS